MGAKDNSHGEKWKVSSVIRAKERDDQAMMELLHKFGPLSVYIDASHWGAPWYAGGVFGSKKNPGVCSPNISKYYIFFNCSK